MYFEQIKTLMALADGRDPVIGGLAKMMLAMLEALRDAEMRADLSEAQLDAKRGTLSAIKAVLVQAKEDDPTEALRRIVSLLD